MAALYLISCSDIFDAMFASKAGAGDTIIQQGMCVCVCVLQRITPLFHSVFWLVTV